MYKKILEIKVKVVKDNIVVKARNTKNIAQLMVCGMVLLDMIEKRLAADGEDTEELTLISKRLKDIMEMKGVNNEQN